MAEIGLKEGIKLELLEGDGCCDPGCSPETCGSEQMTAEQPEKVTPVIAGGSGDGCCGPECGPDTCGS